MLTARLRVLYLCPISELGKGQSENRRILNRQNEVQETQGSLFPICRRLPKLDIAGSTPASRSIRISNLRSSTQSVLRLRHELSPSLVSH